MRMQASSPSYGTSSQHSNKDTRSSIRQNYPHFLSFPDTALLQLSWAWRGFMDACRWDAVATAVYSDSEIRANVLKSFMLNTLSLMSIYIFDLILRLLVGDQQTWLRRNVSWLYRILWLFPLVGGSLYLNSSWCLAVANRTYMLRYGSRKAATISTYSAIFTSLATSAYRTVMMCTFAFVSLALAYLPVVGNTASLMFFCWVNAYYCFEFIWIARDLSLAQRIRHLEERWAYYFMFGLPLSALCMWGSSLANAAMFALLFPSYIIMATHARPVPSNPYNPCPVDAFGNASPGSTVRYPSPFVPIRLHVFGPVLWINDRLVSILNIGSGAGHTVNTAIRVRQLAQGTSAISAEGDATSKTCKRRMSDTMVESVEEGNGDVNAACTPRYTHVVEGRTSGMSCEVPRLSGACAKSPGRRKKFN